MRISTNDDAVLDHNVDANEPVCRRMAVTKGNHDVGRTSRGHPEVVGSQGQ
jgi:hypothetical protein